MDVSSVLMRLNDRVALWTWRICCVCIKGSPLQQCPLVWTHVEWEFGHIITSGLDCEFEGHGCKGSSVETQGKLVEVCIGSFSTAYRKNCGRGESLWTTTCPVTVDGVSKGMLPVR